MPKMTRGLVIRDCTIIRLSRARMVESRRKDVVGQALTNGPAPDFGYPSRQENGSSHVTGDSSLFRIFRPRDGWRGSSCAEVWCADVLRCGSAGVPMS